MAQWNEEDEVDEGYVRLEGEECCIILRPDGYVRLILPMDDSIQKCVAIALATRMTKEPNFLDDTLTYALHEANPDIDLKDVRTKLN